MKMFEKEVLLKIFGSKKVEVKGNMINDITRSFKMITTFSRHEVS